MADQVYKGFFVALESGALAAPDIRLGLALSGFSFDADSVNLDDGTIDEYDGAGYARIDAAAVTTGYVDADDEWQLDFTSGAQFGGDEVAPATEVVARLFAYLYIDGTAANDIILGSTDQAGIAGINGNNGTLTLNVPAAGLMFGRQA